MPVGIQAVVPAFVVFALSFVYIQCLRDGTVGLIPLLTVYLWGSRRAIAVNKRSPRRIG